MITKKKTAGTCPVAQSEDAWASLLERSQDHSRDPLLRLNRTGRSPWRQSLPSGHLLLHPLQQHGWSGREKATPLFLSGWWPALSFLLDLENSENYTQNAGVWVMHVTCGFAVHIWTSHFSVILSSGVGVTGLVFSSILQSENLHLIRLRQPLKCNI